MKAGGNEATADRDRNGISEIPISACFMHYLFSNFLSFIPDFLG